MKCSTMISQPVLELTGVQCLTIPPGQLHPQRNDGECTVEGEKYTKYYSTHRVSLGSAPPFPPLLEKGKGKVGPPPPTKRRKQ